MNKHSKHLRHLLVLSLVLAAAAFGTRTGLADGGSIDHIDPSTVSNVAATTLVVYGAGTAFDNTATVVVGGVGALDTKTIGPTTLTAVVPAGSPVGTFQVTVVMSGTSQPIGTATLKITGPTSTPEPTGTPAPTAFVRPFLVVQSYGASSAALVPGSDIDFEMTLVNSGQSTATNVAATFTTGDLVPRVTGGVRAVGAIGPGGTARIFQPFSVGRSVSGMAALEVAVSYTDVNGQSYNDKFALTFPVAVPQGIGATRTPTPTPTARAIVRPQLLITAYRTDAEPLQPGTRFSLHLEIENLGSATAKRVTMIAGGGSTTSSSGPGVTPEPGTGGVSGSGGDFSNFAPVGASNVQSLGEVQAAGHLQADQTFVVNATTKAGAYPMKFSFLYADQSGATYTDDQVITLLVYQLPQVDVSFYRDTGPLFAGQPNVLPLQIVNLGRNSSVLGNMRVDGAADFTNNVILVGALDPGGFFTLDATVIPQQAGPLELLVTVDYTDDFNQQQRITQTLSVEVLEAPPIDNGGQGPDGGPFVPTPQAETTWQKVVRFLRGLFGLDSGLPTQAPGGPGVMPTEPVPGDGVPVGPGKG